MKPREAYVKYYRYSFWREMFDPRLIILMWIGPQAHRIRVPLPRCLNCGLGPSRHTRVPDGVMCDVAERIRIPGSRQYGIHPTDWRPDR